MSRRSPQAGCGKLAATPTGYDRSEAEERSSASAAADRAA